MKKLFIPLVAVVSLLGHAQETPKTDDAKANISFFDKKASIRMLLVGNYTNSLTKDVDVLGKHTEGAINNGFSVKYARVNGRFNINKNLFATFLVNFADFKSEPRTRVLELASLQWRPSAYFNVQVGQFRPFFGLEDMYPADIMKSGSWSKQYSLMSANNWESFQLGASLSGSLKEQKIPLRYYYSFYNGNGKNQIQDNDNAKNHAFRLEYDIIPKLQIGANSAFTKVDGQGASAHGVDVLFSKKLPKDYTIELNAEYKIASNIRDYKASTKADKRLSDFQSVGFYAIPSVAKLVDKTNEGFVELSCRYEYLEEIKGGNAGRFYTPMVSYVIGKDYTSKISLLGVFTDYNENKPKTSQYDSTIWSLQYQLRF